MKPSNAWLLVPDLRRRYGVKVWNKREYPTYTRRLDDTAGSWLQKQLHVDEAGTHKSAKANAGTVFAPRDLDLWPSDPKINGFTGLMMEHFCVKFGAVAFLDIVRKIDTEVTDAQTDRQTDRQRHWKPFPWQPSAWVTRRSQRTLPTCLKLKE